MSPEERANKFIEDCRQKDEFYIAMGFNEFPQIDWCETMPDLVRETRAEMAEWVLDYLQKIGVADATNWEMVKEHIRDLQHGKKA